MSLRGEWGWGDYHLKGYADPVTQMCTQKLKRYGWGRTGAATSVIMTLSLLINNSGDELIGLDWMTDVTSEIPLDGCGTILVVQAKPTDDQQMRLHLWPMQSIINNAK